MCIDDDLVTRRLNRESEVSMIAKAQAYDEMLQEMEDLFGDFLMMDEE